MRKKSKQKLPERPDYSNATPEDVARALLLYRPEPSRNPIKRAIRKLRDLIGL